MLIPIESESWTFREKSTHSMTLENNPMPHFSSTAYLPDYAHHGLVFDVLRVTTSHAHRTVRWT